jgi:hypothetical protein
VWLRVQPDGFTDSWYRAAAVDGKAVKLRRATALPWEVARPLQRAFAALRQPGQRYRSVGVTAMRITSLHPLQLGLFEQPAQLAKLERLAQAVDAVNGRFGHDAVAMAASLPASRRLSDLAELGVERREQRLALPLVAVAV